MDIVLRLAIIRQKLLKIAAASNKVAPCCDCNCHVQGYMLNNELWAQATTQKEDYLCLWCVEQRLRRKLVIGDFIDYPINAGIFFGYRMCCDEDSK